MDEFGLPKVPNGDDTVNTTRQDDILEEIEPTQFLQEQPKSSEMMEVSAAHDNIRVPIKPPPSPAPFSHYAPTTPSAHVPGPRDEEPVVEQSDGGAGCCKCVVM